MKQFHSEKWMIVYLTPHDYLSLYGPQLKRQQKYHHVFFLPSLQGVLCQRRQHRPTAAAFMIIRKSPEHTNNELVSVKAEPASSAPRRTTGLIGQKSCCWCGFYFTPPKQRWPPHLALLPVHKYAGKMNSSSSTTLRTNVSYGGCESCPKVESVCV